MFTKASHLLERAVSAAVEELSPVFSRQALVTTAVSGMPRGSLARFRTAVLRAAGVEIGPHSLVQGPIRLTGCGSLSDFTIGHHTLITGDLHIDLGAPVRIGSGVRIGHSVTLLTVNHEVGAPNLRAGTTFFGSIVIENGAWLASRVTVLPGVRIGSGSIVAAGALVVRDVEANTLVAGVPARFVRVLDDGNPHPPIDPPRSDPPPPIELTADSRLTSD